MWKSYSELNIAFGKAFAVIAVIVVAAGFGCAYYDHKSGDDKPTV